MLILLCPLTLAGCGPSRPETVPVSGRVTLDGRPVEGATVMFSPEAEGRPATGTTDAEGNFTLKTFEPGDGALLGKHRVTVTKVESSGVQADRDGLSGEIEPGGIQRTWIVPQHYSRAESSGLTVEVQPGMQPVELQLSDS
jgi:hypothetical protein